MPPKIANRLPRLAQAFDVGVAVLDYQRINGLGTSSRDAKPHRCAIVLDVHRKVLQREPLEQEFVDDGAEFVEGIGEFAWRWTRAVTESKQIGRDEMKPIVELRYQLAEHVGRRREPVQQ